MPGRSSTRHGARIGFRRRRARTHDCQRRGARTRPNTRRMLPNTLPNQRHTHAMVLNVGGCASAIRGRSSTRLWARIGFRQRPARNHGCQRRGQGRDQHTPNVAKRTANHTSNAHTGRQWTQGRATLQHSRQFSGTGARDLHEPTTALSPHGNNGNRNRMLRWAKTGTPKSMRVCAEMHPTTTRFNIARTELHAQRAPHRIQAAACANPRLPTSGSRTRPNTRRMLPNTLPNKRQTHNMTNNVEARPALRPS